MEKNHGVICASALTMSGLVLHDAGELPDSSFSSAWDWLFNDMPWPKPDYSPINWFLDGYNGVYENIFVGYHRWAYDVPQSNSDGTAGYAEGPGYFSDMARAFFPLLRTADNCLDRSANTNLLYQPEIKHAS